MSENNAVKWKRYYEEGTRIINGYTAGDCHILKQVSIEAVSCNIDEQGSEKASSWDLHKNRKLLGSYETLKAAKEAAGKGEAASKGGEQ